MPPIKLPGTCMESLSRILNTTVFAIGEDGNVSVLEITVALLILLIGFWHSRWTDRNLSTEPGEHKVNADVVQIIRRLFYSLVVLILIATILAILKM